MGGNESKDEVSVEVSLDQGLGERRSGVGGRRGSGTVRE